MSHETKTQDELLGGTGSNPTVSAEYSAPTLISSTMNMNLRDPMPIYSVYDLNPIIGKHVSKEQLKSMAHLPQNLEKAFSNRMRNYLKEELQVLKNRKFNSPNRHQGDQKGENYNGYDGYDGYNGYEGEYMDRKPIIIANANSDGEGNVVGNPRSGKQRLQGGMYVNNESNMHNDHSPIFPALHANYSDSMLPSPSLNKNTTVAHNSNTKQGFTHDKIQSNVPNQNREFNHKERKSKANSPPKVNRGILDLQPTVRKVSPSKGQFFKKKTYNTLLRKKNRSPPNATKEMDFKDFHSKELYSHAWRSNSPDRNSLPKISQQDKDMKIKTDTEKNRNHNSSPIPSSRMKVKGSKGIDEFLLRTLATHLKRLHNSPRKSTSPSHDSMIQLPESSSKEEEYDPLEFGLEISIRTKGQEESPILHRELSKKYPSLDSPKRSGESSDLINSPTSRRSPTLSQRSRSQHAIFNHPLRSRSPSPSQSHFTQKSSTAHSNSVDQASMKMQTQETKTQTTILPNHSSNATSSRSVVSPSGILSSVRSREKSPNKPSSRLRSTSNTSSNLEKESSIHANSSSIVTPKSNQRRKMKMKHQQQDDEIAILLSKEEIQMLNEDFIEIPNNHNTSTSSSTNLTNNSESRAQAYSIRYPSPHRYSTRSHSQNKMIRVSRFPDEIQPTLAEETKRQKTHLSFNDYLLYSSKFPNGVTFFDTKVLDPRLRIHIDFVNALKKRKLEGRCGMEKVIEIYTIQCTMKIHKDDPIF